MVFMQMVFSTVVQGNSYWVCDEGKLDKYKKGVMYGVTVTCDCDCDHDLLLVLDWMYCWVLDFLELALT